MLWHWLHIQFPSDTPLSAFSILMICVNELVTAFRGCNMMIILSSIFPFTLLTWHCSLKKSFLFLSSLIIIIVDSRILFCFKFIIVINLFYTLGGPNLVSGSPLHLAPISFWYLLISLNVFFSPAQPHIPDPLCTYAVSDLESFIFKRAMGLFQCGNVVWSQDLGPDILLLWWCCFKSLSPG